jgi:hypothetical protein
MSGSGQVPVQLGWNREDEKTRPLQHLLQGAFLFYEEVKKA